MTKCSDKGFDNQENYASNHCSGASWSKVLSIRTVSSEDFEDKIISTLRNDVTNCNPLQKSFHMLEHIQADACRRSLEEGKFLLMHSVLDFADDHSLFKHSRHESPKSCHDLHSSPKGKLKPLEHASSFKLQALCSQIATNYDLVSSLPSATRKETLPSLRLSAAMHSSACNSLSPFGLQSRKLQTRGGGGGLYKSSSYK